MTKKHFVLTFSQNDQHCVLWVNSAKQKPFITEERFCCTANL